MDPWIFSDRFLPRVTLIFLVACFYAGVVVVNNELLFFWAADASYRYWFYPPAGVRLMVIMLLGWPGLLGYFIAALAIIYGKLIPEVVGFEAALVIACARALSLWAGLVLYGKLSGVKSPWDTLTWRQLPFLALFVNFFSAVTAQLFRVLLGVEEADEIVRNVALNTLGDTLGSIAFLAVVIQLRRDYRQYAQSTR